MQPVAIVGAAVRFPGASDPPAFHDLTLSGRRLFRLDRPADPGSPHAVGITPWHALAMQTAASALADAFAGRDCGDSGWTGRGRAGVVVANCPSPAATVPAGQVPAISIWIRDRLGLGDGAPVPRWPAHDDPAGPASGCSLHAVAVACDALNSGEFDLMLAGGVSSRSGASMGDGSLADIRVYDANPTGVLPGEGCGMIVLMRAADARAARLPMYAGIAGWSTMADGPDLPAVIRAAYDRSGIDPADVQLVEGHGAATADEDLAELRALLDVLGPRPAGRLGGCALGAVSANIGDARGAAGVAALLKTSLAMTAATIPPSTGCVEPHELLRGRSTPFRLPRSPEEWPEATAQVAAVNSLGVTSTAGAPRSGATHLVLRREQDAHRPGRRRARVLHGLPPQGGAAEGGAAEGGAASRHRGHLRHAAPAPGRPGT